MTELAFDDVRISELPPALRDDLRFVIAFYRRVSDRRDPQIALRLARLDELARLLEAPPP
jgi:hypothetical protein